MSFVRELIVISPGNLMKNIKRFMTLIAMSATCTGMMWCHQVAAADYRDPACTTTHSSSDLDSVNSANYFIKLLNQSYPGNSAKVATLTPLVYDIAFDDIGALETALNKGLDPNTIFVLTNIDPFAPKNEKPIESKKSLLDLATSTCSVNVAELLVERGANVGGGGEAVPLVTSAAAGADKLVEFLLAHGAEVDQKDFNNDTALSSAVVQGHASTVKILLDHGANPNQKTVFKNVPLVDASSDSSIRQMLIQRGATNSAPSKTSNQSN
jgi:ankyrin repeat protein